MKRIIALVSLISILLVNVVSLSGCTTSDKDALKMGQWLALVSDSFGMESFQQKTPYFENVEADNPAFAYFQMAAEWEILEPSEDITSDTVVKWNDVLISLINAGGFLNVDATDEEKIEYAIKNFDPSIKEYWGKRNITMQEAVPLLDIAKELWVNKTYTEKIETVAFDDEVKNYIDSEDVEYVCEGEMITSASETMQNLKAGDIYVLPANENNPSSINKVKSVEVVDGKVIIINDESFSQDEALEYIGEFQIQETAPVDFGRVVGIYDEFGNPIVYETDESASIGWMPVNAELSPTMLGRAFVNNSGNTIQTGIFDSLKAGLKFKVKDYTISLSFSSDDVSVQLTKEISTTTNRYREETTKVYGKTSFKDVELTKDFDYSWGTLHSATVKLDYKTVIEAGINKERTTNIGNPAKGDKDVKKTLESTIKAYKSALENMKKDVKQSECKDEIYICRLSIADAALASVDFIIKGKVTAEGEVKFIFEVEGAQGIEYKNGKLRYIKSDSFDCDFAADAKLEVTIGPGFAITLLKKVALVEITVDAGIGASFGAKAHMFDSEGHLIMTAEATLLVEDADELAQEELYTTVEEIAAFAQTQGGDYKITSAGDSVRLGKGICVEWALYPILKLEISGQSLVGKLAKNFGVTLSLEVLGSDDTFLKGHMDIPGNVSNMINSETILQGASALIGVGASCTYDFKPWDIVEETETETEEGAEGLTEDSTEENAEEMDMIKLNTMRVFLDVGETKEIKIVGLPKGYELKDIVAKIEDPTVVLFDLKHGTVSGVNPGTTILVVETKDGKYETFCAITVNEEVQVDVDSLDMT